MGRRPRRAGVVSFGALLLSSGLGVSVAARARAEPGSEQPLRLQYEAAESCPDAVVFFRQVRARTRRVRLAAPEEPATLVAVSLRNESIHSIGTLVMPTASGVPFVRRVEAESCEEVALALSLVLALAYDPDALTSFVAPSAGSAAPDGSNGPATPIAGPAPASPIAAAPSPVGPGFLAVPGPVAPGVSSEPLPSSPFGLAVGLEALLRSGVAPGVTPLVGPFIEYGVARDGGVTPRAAAALLLSPDREVSGSETERRATLRFIGMRLSGCPASLVLAPGLSASPCLAVDAGRLTGMAGNAVSPPRIGEIFWLSATGLARLRWKVASPFFVEVSGGGGVTFVRGTFDLQGPPEPLHSIPVGIAEAGLSLGAHFP